MVAFSKAPIAVNEAAVMPASFANFVSAANASSPESRATTRVSEPASPAIFVLFMASGRAALSVTAFLYFFDDLGAEGFEIAGITRSYDALVDYDFGILPLGSGVGDVGLDGLERRHPASLRDAGLYQQPRRVADGRDDLLRIEDVLDELERLGLDPQQVWIDLTARKDDRVVVAGRDLVERLVDLHGVAPILLVPTLDLARCQRNDVNGRACLLQAVPGHLELGLLETVRRKDCDLFAVDIHVVDPRCFPAH